MSPLVAFMIGAESVTNQRFPVSRKVIGLEIITVVLVTLIVLLLPARLAEAAEPFCRNNICCWAQVPEVSNVRFPKCADNTNVNGEGEAYCVAVVTRNGLSERYRVSSVTRVDSSLDVHSVTGKLHPKFSYRGVTCQVALPDFVKAAECSMNGTKAECSMVFQTTDGALVPYRSTVTVSN